MKASKLGDDLWDVDDESEVVVKVNGRYLVVGEVVDKGDCIVELVLQPNWTLNVNLIIGLNQRFSPPFFGSVFSNSTASALSLALDSLTSSKVQFGCSTSSTIQSPLSTTSPTTR